MTEPTEQEITFVVATNNPDVLNRNFLRSPDLLQRRFNVIVVKNPESIGIAYNYGIDNSDSEILIFVHQDVYLVREWTKRLLKSVREMDDLFPLWAVAGPIGVDESGKVRGSVWSTGLGRMVGEPLQAPAPVAALDELLIVMKRSSGLRFDPDLPGFHFYGLDIALAARAHGREAVAFDAPVIHNSRPVGSLLGNYRECFFYMRRKYYDSLPIRSTVTEITRFGLPYVRALVNVWKRRLGRWISGTRCLDQATIDPANLSKTLGLEASDVSPHSE